MTDWLTDDDEPDVFDERVGAGLAPALVACIGTGLVILLSALVATETGNTFVASLVGVVVLVVGLVAAVVLALVVFVGLAWAAGYARLELYPRARANIRGWL